MTIMMMMMMVKRRKVGDIPGLFRGLGGDFVSLYSTFLCGLDQFKYPSISALTPDHKSDEQNQYYTHISDMREEAEKQG